MLQTDQILSTYLIPLSEKLLSLKMKLVCAESCTGGQISASITALAGSSDWFDSGFVTYSNTAKQNCLAVSADSLEQYGAVSEQVAVQMVQGALTHSDAQFALSTTGIAGPGGGSKDKPVGMVCFAWQALSRPMVSDCFYFTGLRNQIRFLATEHALCGALRYLSRFYRGSE